MRAAILGAAGTPYHDQLFFFDIQLSPDHPSSVPKVLFQSHGNRINPNLYADGKACLDFPPHVIQTHAGLLLRRPSRSAESAHFFIMSYMWHALALTSTCLASLLSSVVAYMLPKPARQLRLNGHYF